MRIENGKLVMEKFPCIHCHDGVATTYRRCRYYDKAVKGKFPHDTCPDCGSKSRHGHKMVIPTGTKTCEICGGTGMREETRFDSIPHEVWQSLNFKVYRSNRRETLYEELIGLGCYSCTDYGRHNSMTDDELIKKVKDNNSYIQALKISDENFVVAHEISIRCSDNGYSVI